MTSREKNRRILIAAGIAVLVVLLLWFVLPPVFFAFLPFIIAAVIAKIIDPAVVFLNKKLRVPRRIASLLMVLISISLLGWALYAIADKLWAEVNSLINNRDRIVVAVQGIFENMQVLLKEKLGIDIALSLKSIEQEELGKQLSGSLGSALLPVLQGTVTAAKAVPSAFVFTVALILGTYFISSDPDFYSRIFSKVPEKVRNYYGGFKNQLGTALIGYIKAQLTLMSITFAELLVGFLITGGDVSGYAFLLALLICILDALPVFGTGTVLIPWSLYSFLSGDIRMGICMLILYLVCLTVRQLLEPRIIGERIGLHPLATLMSIYVGLKFFGVIGMLLGPLIVLIIKYFAQAGVFSDLWSFITTGKTKEENQ